MIDPDRRKAIYQLHLAGVPLGKISRQFHVSLRTVRTIIRQQGNLPQTVRKDKIHIDPELLRRLYQQCDGWMQRVHEILVEEEGEFQVVLSWDQDRFGRFDPIGGGYWILPFRNAGVRLETIAQGRIDWNDFAGRLLYLVQQEAKHAYLRDLSRNVLRGQLAKARAGEGADGSAPYGYRLEDGRRVIVPEEAAVVRMMFEQYLKGLAIRAVAAYLNAKGIPSPRGKRWRGSTIRSFLVNKKYTGTFIWGK